MDETCKQLVAEVRPPIPAAPGESERYDMEYERCGVAEVFLFTEPLGGWRRTAVTQRRTRTDWAGQVRRLLEVDYPQPVGAADSPTGICGRAFYCFTKSFADYA